MAPSATPTPSPQADIARHGGIAGLWVALTTPLVGNRGGGNGGGGNGGIDLPLLVRHASGLLERGCDGVVLFGTTGEGTSFSLPERLASVTALLAAGIAPDRIGLGAGFPALPDTVAAMQAGLQLGLTRFLVLPPYYYRDISAGGMLQAFSAILEGVHDPRVRMTLYHIPQVSGVAIPPSVAVELRHRFGDLIAGLKDSSGDWRQFLAFRAEAPEVPVLVGNEADIGRAVAAGGAGTICGLANLLPLLVRAIFSDPAAEAPIRAALAAFTGPFIQSIKAVLAARTGQPNWRLVRPPLEPIDAEAGIRLARILPAE